MVLAAESRLDSRLRLLEGLFVGLVRHGGAQVLLQGLLKGGDGERRKGLLPLEELALAIGEGRCLEDHGATLLLLGEAEDGRRRCSS